MIINSIEINIRQQTATISLFAGCGGVNVSSIVCADSKEAVSEYKKLSKSHNPHAQGSLFVREQADHHQLIPTYKSTSPLAVCSGIEAE